MKGNYSGLVLQYWHDPFEVPDYISMCMASVRKCHSKVVQLDRRDYIRLLDRYNLPEVKFWDDKMQCRKMVHQVESNILRCLAMHHYGTVYGPVAWIDADTLCLHDFEEFFAEVPRGSIGAIKWDGPAFKIDNNLLYAPTMMEGAVPNWVRAVKKAVEVAQLEPSEFNHRMVGCDPLEYLADFDTVHTWPENQIMWGRNERDKWLKPPVPKHRLSDALSVNFVNSVNKETLGKMTRERIMSTNCLARNIFIQAGF